MKEKGMIGKKVQKTGAEQKNFIRDGICQLKIGFNKNESCLKSGEGRVDENKTLRDKRKVKICRVQQILHTAKRIFHSW